MDPFGRTFNRLLAVFGLSIVFVATASIISPRTSSAGPTGAPSLADRKIIGRLIGADYEVVIYADAAGPRYDVYNLKGDLLAEHLTIEQLGRRFSGLEAQVSEVMRPGSTRIGVVDEIRERPLAERR